MNFVTECGYESATDLIANKLIPEVGLEMAVVNARRALVALQSDSEDPYLAGSIQALKEFVFRHTHKLTANVR